MFCFAFYLTFSELYISIWFLQIDVVSDIEDAEGLVLLFDPSTKDGFESVKTWWKKNASDVHVGVKLCLAYVVTKTSPKVEDASRSRHAREWCLDNGFELLCSEKKSCWVMDIDEAEGGEPCGATGMSRVVEALSANMWCSMKRGVPPVPKQMTTKKIEKVSSPPSSSSSPVVKKEVKPATKKLSESDALRSLMSLDGGAEDGEGDFDDMSDLFQEARNLRAQACSGQLSDTERRERAEAMMLRLMSVMGLDEDDEEENKS